MTRLSDDDVYSWLRQIPLPNAGSPDPSYEQSSRHHKRRRIQGPPSPPLSTSQLGFKHEPKQRESIEITLPPLESSPRSAMSASTSRKRKAMSTTAAADEDDDVQVDDLQTPRPSRMVHPPLLPPSEALNSDATSASGKSSPTKELSKMELSQSRVITRVLDSRAQGIPNELVALLSDINKISMHRGYIPQYLEPALSGLDDTSPLRMSLDATMYDPTPSPDSQHGYPTPDTMLAHIQSIVASSWDAQETLQVESGWNILVHSQVLVASLSGAFPRPGLVCPVPCTHARIIKWYLPDAGFSKMVDFALAVNPRIDPDPRVMPAIDALRSRLPLGVVNHTDYDALRERPIAVSIETKRRGEQQSKAEAQMGVWHAAHWAFLAAHVKDRLATLPFLPGLLVVGDEWKLVASAYSNKQTILFLDRSIGSTNSELGTLQIMATLGRLRTWVEQVYWPWYKREMLGLDSAQHTAHGVQDAGGVGPVG